MGSYSNLWTEEPATLGAFFAGLSKAGKQLLTGGHGDAFKFAPDGSGESTDDPAWLLEEDARHGAEWRGFAAIDPATVDSPTASQRTALFMVVDPQRQFGHQMRLPAIKLKDDSWKLAKGEAGDIVFPDLPPSARYAAWDLQTFSRWTANRIANWGESLQERVKRYGVTTREIAEFSGFAVVSANLSTRRAHGRRAGIWRGQPKALAWPPGEQGIRQVYSEEVKREGPPSMGAIWWTTPTGIIQARYMDYATGETLGNTWRLESERGLGGTLLRKIGASTNRLVQVTAPTPIEYALSIEA